ncbi:hypothetical protein [Pseudomonas brassicacearum]|uniref:Uncharacterized protein n=1 Tax=Pseudomonas brassicacearum TaxID=930166 RepID=A0AAJ3FWS3_9PSED|nr:hypothetical protein [Pseudomonas brassicacearum]NUT82392.1 hypothetical protein [Pseudomonas brassicacearum]
MTTFQICVLVGLILSTGLIYCTGYRDGRVEGLESGIEEGTNDERAANAKTIRELEASLQFIRANHKHLAAHAKRLRESQAFGPQERQTLMQIAEKLRLASDTFRAMSSKAQAQQALDLREKALGMAALLDQFKVEDAA